MFDRSFMRLHFFLRLKQRQFNKCVIWAIKKFTNKMEIWRIFGIILTVFSYYDINVSADSDPYEYDDLNNHEFDDYNDRSPGEPLSPKDFDNAESLTVAQYPLSENGDRDPIEIAGEYEGDIILNRYLLTQMQESGKNGIKNEAQKWPNGEIPYLISPGFDEMERSVIARAILEYHRRTCIRFKPREWELDYVQIVKESQGCSSPVGRQGGPQRLTLGPGCVYVGIALHELMHVVGFWHEQSRYDRDDHVTVYFENIRQGMEFNFQKYNWSVIQHLGAAYDTSSIMHYGPYAFSKDKRYPTIIPKNPNDRIGQRQNFSETDVKKINVLYKCKLNNRPINGTHGSSPPMSNTPTTSRTTTEGATGHGNCKDSHENCKKWSEIDECNRNPGWMHVNCKLSCNKCNGCSDGNKHCAAWSRRGECQKNKNYMLKTCPKSCNSCQQVISSVDEDFTEIPTSTVSFEVDHNRTES